MGLMVKNDLLAKLASCEACSDRTLAFQQVLAVQRSCLQMAALAAIDLYEVRVRPLIELELTDIATQMLAPADGTPVQLLDLLIPSFRNCIDPRFAAGWYPNEVTPAGEKLAEGLGKKLESWVTFRNNRPGHGVLDKDTVDREFEPLCRLAANTIAVLGSLFPIAAIINGQRIMVLDSVIPQAVVTSCPNASGQAVVLRQFRSKRGIWESHCQTLDLQSSQEIVVPVETTAPLLMLSSGRRRQRFLGLDLRVGSHKWTPLVDVPSRQTAYFEGRLTELEKLIKWSNDLESRACLLYGDGGIGKTTLALEFIHGLLERPPSDLQFRPQVVCFYSAKMTRWTEHGIQHYTSLQPVIEDAVRQLLYALHDSLDKAWWKSSGEALINRVAGELRSMGVERNATLLIVDNAETLATKPGDDQILGDILTEISRKVARVLVTSRRREKFEAFPIEVTPMDDDAGAALLLRLGRELKAAAIQSAGASRLRKETRDLHGKPILLEALARHVAKSGLSIDAAKRQIVQDAQEGLSEFLYEDAWARISEEHRRVFIILSELDVPLTNHVVGWVCGEVSAIHVAWQQAFEETHFGNQLAYGSESEIDIAPMAGEFFLVKGRELPHADRARLNLIKDSVTRKYRERERALSTPASDRIEEAFRTPEARAAKLSARMGKLEDANLWYEEAVTKDSQNSALFDRFAWFLMQLVGDLDKAEQMAEVACRLDGKNFEAHFTKALIFYRRFDLAKGDEAVILAQEFGKSETACWIQKARARMGNLSLHSRDAERRTVLLAQAERYLTQARKSLVSSDRYYLKNLESCDKIERWVRDEHERGRVIAQGTYVG